MLSTPRRFSASLCLVALLGVQACVSVAPLEPIKNPPTSFRSDNTVEVEFLSPAIVGIRCGERGTAFYGMPVFHAMACGNGKLITMPDPCETFTGGSYAELLCEVRRRPAAEVQSVPVQLVPAQLVPAQLVPAQLVPAQLVPEWQAFLQPASFTAPARPSPTPLKPRARASVQAEFVHPSAVRQRCATRGLEVVMSADGEFVSCSDSERITVPNPCMILTGGWYPRTLCHEMAHANGWAMDHPGGSFLSDARAGIDPNDVPPPRALLAALPKSGALRPASQSPAFLAYAAANGLQAASSAAAVQPAVFDARANARSDRGPGSPFGGAAGLLEALRALQVAVPDLAQDARLFAARLPAPGPFAPAADSAPGPRLRPASDLMTAARLYRASLVAGKPPAAPAYLQSAALAGSDLARPPGADALMTADVSGGASSFALASPEPGLAGPGLSVDVRLTDEGFSVQRLAQADPRPAAHNAEGAAHPGLALCRSSAGTSESAGPAQPAVQPAAQPAVLAAPAPSPPGVKPGAAPFWRVEGAGPPAAAGV